MKTIKENNKYKLKRDGTIWKVFGFDYPCDDYNDPKTGTVYLEETGKIPGKECGMGVVESVFWNYFEEINIK